MLRTLLLSFLLCSGLLAATPASATTFVGAMYAYDGDTLIREGTRLRLHGIDAPEINQTCQDAAGAPFACGQVAAQFLRTLVGRETVACRQRDTDRYGRPVVVCGTSSIPDLAAELVSAGVVMASTRYSRDYAALEAQARAEGRGFWEGTFESPESYRRGNSTAPTGLVSQVASLGAVDAGNPLASLSSLTARSRGESAPMAGQAKGFFGRMFEAWAQRRAYLNSQPFPSEGYGYTEPTWMQRSGADSAAAPEVDPLARAAARFPAQGPGAGGLSESQFCALASLARVDCRH